MAVWCGLLVLEGDSWGMKIDLKAVAENAGVYKTFREYGTGKLIREVQYPLSNVRKMIKLILQYGTPDDFEQVEYFWRGNEKLMKIWRELKEKMKV